MKKRRVTLIAAMGLTIAAGSSVAAANYSWGRYARKPDSWFRGPEGIRVADNIISYQTPHGGWPKNTDMAAGPCKTDRKKLRATFDNGATHSHMRFMARAHAATGEARFKESFLRGLDYIFRAQYPVGGWPQFFPLRGGYSDHITFNDDAMIGILQILREVSASDGFVFVDAERRKQAEQAYRRGIECILRCQIVVDSERTVWCAQHDARTLAPRSARSYELVSLSGGESTGIVLFLMDLDDPSESVRKAIDGASRWFERSKLTGIRVVKRDDDRVVIPDPEAPPLWARFYDIETNKPIFCGRDGKVKARLADIEKERRTGYSWYSSSGSAVLARWPEWRSRVLTPSPATAGIAMAEPVRATIFRVVNTIEIDQVPSWFPVGFCLLTHGESQYVGYYDAEHRMIVAHRNLNEDAWQKTILPSKVGWDSHNYITMAVDSRGDLHLAGNMHCVPLIYFRTRTPGDVTTFERSPMTGKEESRCTYPRFLQDSTGNLVFMYRSGGSGNGRRFFNAFDNESRSWQRFIDGPLFEGQGKRNAYPLGPRKGPDGRFHLVWVWRDTPDCATNHHLSYARSADLKRWETAAGAPVPLPLLLEQSGTWIDAVPPGGGIINGCEKLTFDSRQRPIVSYHKQDEQGHMQIFVARFEDEGWRSRPITTWKKSVVFGGGGAMPFIGIRISGLEKLDPGRFHISYRHRDYGSGRLVLDEASLSPLAGSVAVPRELPAELHAPEMKLEGVRVKMAYDLGESDDAVTRYLLRWETLGAHHDRPRQPPLPPASTLKLIELERTTELPTK